MIHLTPHFTLDEFLISSTADALGILNIPEPAHLPHIQKLAESLERVRALLGHPLHISSGYRCSALNKAVGGVSNSDHALGWAADFECPGFGSPYEVALHLAHAAIPFDQLIHEKKPGSWWVHWSINPRLRGDLLTLMGTNPNHYAVGILERA